VHGLSDALRQAIPPSAPLVADRGCLSVNEWERTPVPAPISVKQEPNDGSRE
jgi:hypothetical protein